MKLVMDYSWDWCWSHGFIVWGFVFVFGFSVLYFVAVCLE